MPDNDTKKRSEIDLLSAIHFTLANWRILLAGFFSALILFSGIYLLSSFRLYSGYRVTLDVKADELNSAQAFMRKTRIDAIIPFQGYTKKVIVKDSSIIEMWLLSPEKHAPDEESAKKLAQCMLLNYYLSQIAVLPPYFDYILAYHDRYFTAKELMTAGNLDMPAARRLMTFQSNLSRRMGILQSYQTTLSIHEAQLAFRKDTLDSQADASDLPDVMRRKIASIRDKNTQDIFDRMLSDLMARDRTMVQVSYLNTIPYPFNYRNHLLIILFICVFTGFATLFVYRSILEYKRRYGPGPRKE